MPTPFLSEIRAFAFGFVPDPQTVWRLCDGQSLQIAQYSALYALLGVRYGGDGIRTFNLPDLRGSVALGVGLGYAIADRGGENEHLLLPEETPMHSHALLGVEGEASQQVATAAGGVVGSVDAAFAEAPAPGPALTSLALDSLAFTGQSQAHDNRQPSLAVNYCIATSGEWPVRS